MGEWVGRSRDLGEGYSKLLLMLSLGKNKVFSLWCCDDYLYSLVYL